MSFTNFAALQSLTGVGGTDQFLVSLNNGLSGASGFGRVATAAMEKSLGVYTAVQSNSANWQNTYSTVSSQSANNASVYSTVIANSGKWDVFTGTVSAATFVASVSSTSRSNYIFALADASKTIIDAFNTNTYYGVPSNNTVAFPTGSQLVVIQGNKTASNYTVLSAGTGVTINSFSNSLSLAGNYAAGTLIKTDTNVWYLIGNLK